jgi:hypothetical protein
MLARALFASAALAVGAVAFAFPPTTQRFKVVETNHSVADLSAFGQGEQVTHVITSSFVTLSGSDSAGGRSVKLVIDSIKLDSVSGAPMTQAAFDSARGVWVAGWVGPDGVLSAVQADGPRGAAATTILRALLPKVTSRVRVGDRWTDTTTVEGSGEGVLAGATTRRITNWAVSGEETVGGVRARKVESAFSQTISGAIEGPNGSMQIDGTGTGTALALLAADGRHFGGNVSVSLSLAISIAQAPEPIPVTVTTSSIITTVR